MLHLRFQRTLPSRLSSMNYTTIREFFADAIGSGKVAPLARVLAFGDQFFHFRVAHAPLASP